MRSKKSKDKPLTLEQKFIVSRIIAQYYMKGGQFGYKRGKDYIEQQLNYMISSSTYNNCLTNIVYMGFKELQDFLRKNTQKNIKVINHQQWGIIRTPMIRCREWMRQSHIDTFFKLISSHYHLKTVSITKNEALSLYDELYSLVINHQQKEEIMQQRRISKQKTIRQQKFKQILNNQQQNIKATSKDEQKESPDLQLQINSQYFFQTVKKQKIYKDAEIDYDKFQGDLGLCKQQEKKQPNKS